MNNYEDRFVAVLLGWGLVGTSMFLGWYEALLSLLQLVILVAEKNPVFLSPPSIDM